MLRWALHLGSSRNEPQPDFFALNHDVILFVYGQVFFVMGLAIAFQSRRYSRLDRATLVLGEAITMLRHSLGELRPSPTERDMALSNRLTSLGSDPRFTSFVDVSLRLDAPGCDSLAPVQPEHRGADSAGDVVPIQMPPCLVCANLSAWRSRLASAAEPPL